MRAIEVSAEVWAEIAARGKFGEREDDVLRRVFGLKATNLPIDVARSQSTMNKPKRLNRATDRQSAYLTNGRLQVEYQSGPRKQFMLPASKNEKMAIREVLDSALAFGKETGATIGQLNAIRKALTDAGYHLTK